MHLQSLVTVSITLIALSLTACDAEQALGPKRRASKLAIAAHELYLKRNYADALPLYEKAARLYAGDVITQRGLVDTRLGLRQYDLTVRDADAALALFPSDWRLLETRGDALVALDRKNEAIRDYRRCIEMDPSGYWEPWMKLASVQIAVGATAEARATYLDLLSRYPGHKGARKALNELKQ